MIALQQGNGTNIVEWSLQKSLAELSTNRLKISRGTELVEWSLSKLTMDGQLCISYLWTYDL